MKNRIAIEVKKLSLSIDGQGHLFKDVSFSLKQGEVMCILGCNGIGKSSLIKSICGIFPTKGMDSKGSVTTKKISYVSQLSELECPLSVLDFVLCGRLESKGYFALRSKHDIDVCMHYLEKLNIIDLKETLFSNLSGGQQQITLLARSLASQCPVIILDEPFSALDLGNEKYILDVIMSLAKDENKAILYTSHMPQHCLLTQSNVLCLFKNKHLLLSKDMLKDKKHTLEIFEEMYGCKFNQYYNEDNYIYSPEYYGFKQL